MYSRRDQMGGDDLRFGVSGRLWHGVLVFFDRESDSLWTQLDGRSIQGARIGERLEHFPSVYTTWADWQRAHPETLVLEKSEEAREQTASHYADYFADEDRVYMPHLAENLGAFAPKEIVFGTVQGGEAAAVTEVDLRRHRVINAYVGGMPVAWVLDEETGSPLLALRRIGDRVLELAPEGTRNPARLLRDEITGEVRSLDELKLLRVDRAYGYAWSRTHPSSLRVEVSTLPR